MDFVALFLLVPPHKLVDWVSRNLLRLFFKNVRWGSRNLSKKVTHLQYTTILVGLKEKVSVSRFTRLKLAYLLYLLFRDEGIYHLIQKIL